ncbi:DUF397 domain-containing protein [Streptomyces sp. SID11385]|uniref:DUF397 domain-containing protein n=1 Tax=Streptomyces sp. SID11385 TaxID=2706031 RepID=UPI0013C698E7|nr:DUF397 domain-containing protein [Streptomyces sp. SID11385]
MSTRHGQDEHGGANWRKSSHSGDTGQCVEFADLRATHAAIGLRDSKNVPGPVLLVAPAAFTALVTGLSDRA